MNDRFVGLNAEVLHHIYIENSSTGAGRTGLVYNTAGLVGGMAVPGSGGVSVTFETITTLGEYEAPSSDSHVRFKEVDATYLPGVYEIHLPAAYFTTTSPVPFTLSLRGAATMKTTIVQIQKSIPVTAEGLISFGIPVLGGTETTITLPQLDANAGADGVYEGLVVTVNKSDGSQPSQIGVVTSSVISTGQTLLGIKTSKSDGQWWWTPGSGDTADLKLTASPLVVSPQQIADAVAEAGFSITVVSPLSQNGRKLEIVRGDDYANADGRAIDFTSASWPTLTAATVSFQAKATPGAATLTKAMSVVTATGTKKVRLELADTDTASLTPGAFAYDVVATLTNGNKVTLVRGAMTLLDDLE